jgi:thiol-disulfide isomerase/thioredoxin
MSSSDTTEGPPPPGRSRKRAVTIGVGVVAAVVLVTVVSIVSGGPANGVFPSTALDGTQIGPIDLQSLSVGRIHGPWTTGHPSVVVFFASWCTPCKSELPRVAEWERTHDLGGVHFIGIDSNDELTAGRQMARRSVVLFPSGFDQNGTVTSGTFYLDNLPDTVFIEGDGTVLHVVFGSVSNRQLAVGVAELG